MTTSVKTVFPTPPWPRLSGQRVVLTGEFANQKALQELITVEGGFLTESVSAETDYLVTGKTCGTEPSVAEEKAQELNGQGATIVLIMGESRFLGRLAPSQTELLTLLKSAGGLNWIRLFRQVLADWLPSLAECDLSDAFLRYKGAEAGEIDWRLTETIPEDYYAL